MFRRRFGEGSFDKGLYFKIPFNRTFEKQHPSPPIVPVSDRSIEMVAVDSMTSGKPCGLIEEARFDALNRNKHI